MEPLFEVRDDTFSHVVRNVVHGVIHNPTIEIGKVHVAMQEYESTMSKGTADSLSFLFGDLIVSVDIQKNVKAMEILEMFGFWKEYSMVWEVKHVPNIVLDIDKVGTFVFVPGYVDQTDVLFG